jgi:hypothetical protein
VVEAYIDNPAGRLHRILVAMKKGRPNVGVMYGMAEVLDINPPFLSDVARAVLDVFNLAIEAQGEVERLNDEQPKELLLRWQPKVMDALNAMFFQRSSPALTLGVVAGSYGEDDLVALEFCSATLHRLRRELVIERDSLARIREQIADLLVVLESDAALDGELRSLLLRHVRAMLRACDSYDRCGTVGIRDAVNQMVGALVTNPDLVVRKESSPGTWQKTATVIALLTSLVGLGTNVMTAIEKASSAPAIARMVPQVRELPPGTGSADPPSSHTHAVVGPG